MSSYVLVHKIFFQTFPSMTIVRIRTKLIKKDSNSVLVNRKNTQVSSQVTARPVSIGIEF